MTLKVVVGIPAYNEEKNISNLLSSLLHQKEEEFTISKIIVACDGCTDKTVSKVKQFKDSRIHLIDSKKRVSQNLRIIQILSHNKSDILVLIDADMILKDKDTIRRLVQPIIRDNKVGLVTANTIPVSARTFIEDAINNYILARQKLQNYFDFGKTIYVAHGFLAYSSGFLQSFTLPRGIINYDAYSYIACVSSGWKHRYVHSAVAYYRSVQTAEDLILQSTRHQAGGSQLYQYFDHKLLNKYFFIPLRVNWRLFLYQIIHNPAGYITLKTLNLLSWYKSKVGKNRFNVMWNHATTSKSPI